MFNVGDEVQIKSWEEMEAEFGVTCLGNIPCNFTFTSEMKYLCGKTATITKIMNGKLCLQFHDGTECPFNISAHMVKKLAGEEKEEPMQELDVGFDVEKGVKDAMELLTQYHYLNHNENAVKKILETSLRQKSWLREMLRHHPHWDEQQQAVIYKENYETGIDKDNLHKSVQWFKDMLLDSFCKKYHVDFDPNKYNRLRDKMEFAERYGHSSQYCLDYVRETIQRQHEELISEYKRLDDIKRNTFSITDSEYRDWRLPFDKHDELICVREFLDFVATTDTSNVDDQILHAAKCINKFWDTKARSGQKISRLVQKVLTHYELDQIKIMKEVVHNGVPTMKNFGYEYYRAMFGDAINPIRIKKYTVISINPFDYWTMSFGKSWSSCQTIDKKNLRMIGSNNYHGQSSSGTESYMLDDSTVIFYTVDENYEGEMWKAPKDRRINFHLAPDAKSFIFGRLYPDGRDGGETGLAAQFRNVFQKTIAECNGFNNLWKSVNGAVYDKVYSFGTHYRDYENYDVCGVSVLSGTERMQIKIGHNPICPSCGKEHAYKESIFCREHHGMEITRCAKCGNVIEELIICCVETGKFYCCKNCARNDGVRFCRDDERYHSEGNYFLDNYNDCFYHDLSKMVTTPDGRNYYGADHAEAYGWKLVDGQWVRKN